VLPRTPQYVSHSFADSALALIATDDLDDHRVDVLVLLVRNNDDHVEHNLVGSLLSGGGDQVGRRAG
jgi:hypothetical protein